jgi:hypothetical protein
MPTKDIDKAVSRFSFAIGRFIRGARIQRDRIVDRSANAPVITAGPWAITNLNGLPDNDVDYYIYELGRIRAAAQEMLTAFDSPTELVDALAAFDAAVPKLPKARNPLTHASDDARLDDAAWFEGLVLLGTSGYGSVEYLVDPRYQHHDAAEALAAALLAYLDSRK